jgi:molybdopterin molybdotransferase
MLDFDEALRRVLAVARLLPSERVALPQAVGRVLHGDIIADRDLPATDTSAMDGYALSRASLPAAGPFRVEVRGESRAGHALLELQTGCACRIFTGARLPRGADGVVLQENVRRIDDWIEFEHRPRAFEHVRPQGQDLAKGALALQHGARLTPFSLGLLASLGLHEVPVGAAPRVAILCTGDELITPGSDAEAARGAVLESNGPSLAALVRAVGAVPVLLPIVKDDLASLQGAIAPALQHSDVLLTVGGVSVGDRDLVKPALQAVGVEVEFWKVRIKPGKPLVLGNHPRAIVLGLPGNPVSAQVTFCLFAAPLLRHMQGDRSPVPALQSATLTRALTQSAGRLGLYRARLSGDTVTPLDNQSSGSAVSLAQADALIFVPPETEQLPAGERVQLLRLSDI